MMEKNAKIYVAGHRGMVGSAIVRELQRQGYTNIITRTHKELDLTRQDAVEEFFAQEKPEYVFLAAAKVGGIVANQEALADFMYDNMTLEMNAIHSAWKNGCKKLEFLGSSCIYPRMAPQPMKEDCLLTSELEKTNEAYALAKISGLKYCEFLNRQYGTDYISVMPTNLYGPNDNYQTMKKINFIYMWLAGWCATCLLCLYQPFMRIWVGDELCFDFKTVVFFVLYFYLLKMGDIRGTYSEAAGLWWENRYRAILESVVNLVSNYMLVQFLGIYGVILATLLSLFFINFLWGSNIVLSSISKMEKQVSTSFSMENMHSVQDALPLSPTWSAH